LKLSRLAVLSVRLISAKGRTTTGAAPRLVTLCVAVIM
jgi:hypothetical protein